MEKKCTQQKPSCEDACAAKAKAGAKDNCKKDDKECFAKFKQMAAKCVQEKCKGSSQNFHFRAVPLIVAMIFIMGTKYDCNNRKFIFTRFVQKS